MASSIFIYPNGSGVRSLIAGSGISLSPVTGIGDVTVTATGGGGTVTSVTSANANITVATTTTTPVLTIVSAPKLATARTIAGVSFDGSANIDIPASGLSNGVTGSGAVVLATSPSLVTPVLGVASATSIAFGNEALSNYDEGSFTPAITLGGAAVGVTYGAQTGVFTRIGNLFFYRIVITLTSKGSSTGVLLITGLPTVPSFESTSSMTRVTNLAATVNSTIQTRIAASASTIVPSVVTAGVATQLTDAELTNTSNLTLSGFYSA